MAIYTRPSGSEIELADTKEMVAFAKANKWKRESKEDAQIRIKTKTDEMLSDLAELEALSEKA